MDDLHVDGKPIFITAHAVKRARERKIAYPDQVYRALRTGKIRRFGKRGVKFVSMSKRGSVICVGYDSGYSIIIETIERGN